MRELNLSWCWSSHAIFSLRSCPGAATPEPSSALGGSAGLVEQQNWAGPTWRPLILVGTSSSGGDVKKLRPIVEEL